MKRKSTFTILILAISLIGIGPVEASDHSIKIGITERAFGTLGLSYVYTSKIDPKLLPLSLESGAFFPVFLNYAKKSLMDISFYARARSGIYLNKRLIMPFELTFSLDRQQQAMGKFHAFSYNIALYPGVQINPRSFWGLDLEWYETLAVHIAHSEYSKERFTGRYEGETGPKDGWYSLTARRINIGITHRRKMINGSHILISAGLRLSPSPFNIFFEGGMFGQLPFYMDIGFQIPFGEKHLKQ